MKLAISAWAIRNPIPVVVLFTTLLIAGFAGYRSLQIKLYPDVSFPVVQVKVPFPGSAAAEVETQITRVVEAAVSNIAGIDHISSTISLGMSSTAVEFEIGVDPQKGVEAARVNLA